MNPIPLPPQNLQAEKIVLVAAIVSKEQREDIVGEMIAEDFYLDAHGKIFAAIKHLSERGRAGDVPAVTDYLRGQGQLDDVGSGYLSELFNEFGWHRETLSKWRQYAEDVREKSRARRVIHACTETIRDAHSPTGPMEELVSSLEKRLFDVAAGRRSEGTTLRDAMTHALLDIDARAIGQGPRPISTGYTALDQVIGGFRPGQLITIAARPAVGKTALALGILLNLIEQSPALFFSMEMSSVEIANRALSWLSNVPTHQISGNVKMDPDAIEAVMSAPAPIHERLYIDDRSNLSAAEISRAVRRGIRKHGIKLVAVDYLQRMQHDRKAGETTTRQVGETAKQLKTLARDCNIPVICLAQLNRQVESRGGNAEPQLSDLRDSGEIEQESDVVILLHPHEPDPSRPSTTKVDLLIRKQRNGPVGKVTLRYQRPYTRFEDDNYF